MVLPNSIWSLNINSSCFVCVFKSILQIFRRKKNVSIQNCCAWYNLGPSSVSRCATSTVLAWGMCVWERGFKHRVHTTQNPMVSDITGYDPPEMAATVPGNPDTATKNTSDIMLQSKVSALDYSIQIAYLNRTKSFLLIHSFKSVFTLSIFSSIHTEQMWLGVWPVRLNLLKWTPLTTAPRRPWKKLRDQEPWGENLSLRSCLALMWGGDLRGGEVSIHTPPLWRGALLLLPSLSDSTLRREATRPQS